MNPPATAVGLFVCQQVIVDKDTLNPSCIEIFGRFIMDRLPSVPRPISVFASMTDAEGQGIMNLVVTELATGSEVYWEDWPIAFPNRLNVVTVKAYLTKISFPTVGRYSLSILIDDDLVADRILTVVHREDSR